jgi:hypothetical protein
MIAVNKQPFTGIDVFATSQCYNSAMTIFSIPSKRYIGNEIIANYGLLLILWSHNDFVTRTNYTCAVTYFSFALRVIVVSHFIMATVGQTRLINLLFSLKYAIFIISLCLSSP